MYWFLVPALHADAAGASFDFAVFTVITGLTCRAGILTVTSGDFVFTLHQFNAIVGLILAARAEEQ